MHFKLPINKGITLDVKFVFTTLLSGKKDTFWTGDWSKLIFAEKCKKMTDPNEKQSH